MKSLGYDPSEDDLKDMIAEADIDSKLLNQAPKVIKLFFIFNSI